MSLRPQRAIAQPLEVVAGQLPGAQVTGQATVLGLSLNSQQVCPGDLFVALPGHSGHGAQYAPQALARGAVAVLCDQAGADLIAPSVPLVVGQDIRAHLGELAAWFYGYPAKRLTTVGLTGTNGKTTVCQMVAAALARAYGPDQVALLGTAGARVAGRELAQARTTPEAPELQATLAAALELGVTHLVMEVSSHALSQHRVDGLVFDVVGFTNLSRDHLDYHTTMEDYFQAKTALFTRARARAAVIDTTDAWGQRLANQCQLPVQTLASCAQPDLDRTARATTWCYQILRHQPTGSEFLLDGVVGGGSVLDGPVGGGAPVASPPQLTVSLPMLGNFNVANAALALVVAMTAGVPPDQAALALTQMAPVPGRMEVVPGPAGGPTVVVDYAHAPDALAQALAALRPHVSGQLWVVFGAGGDRDHGKRHLMGAAAAGGADRVIVTDDNPRSEEPATIRAEVLAGTGATAGPLASVQVIPDRAEAIDQAIAQGQGGDLIALMGKGHEVTIDYAGHLVDHDDRVVAAAALARHWEVA